MARYKKQDRTCEVVETADGLRYRLDDGTEHRSPSSAGKAVTSGACNGWVFWSVEGTEKPKREPKAKPKKEPATKNPAKAKAAKKGGKAKSAKSSKSARMASDASYGCGVCLETFRTLRAATAHVRATRAPLPTRADVTATRGDGVASPLCREGMWV